MAKSQIKVSTIMFTDIVGYSSMMSKDESHSLKLLAEHNRIIEPVILKHSGKIIKYIGDSIFAQFDNPEAAVLSAVDFQYKLKERNRLAKKRDKIPIRVGIHLGRVIEKGDDLFGNDVNITSRIEGAAPIEGIAMSSDIIDAIEVKDKFHYRKMGHIKLKNIPEPKMIYKVYLNQEDWQSENDESLLKENLKRGLHLIDIEEYQVRNTASLAMLDMEISSENSDDITYTEYLTEDIISDFQSINDIRVPSRKESNNSITRKMGNAELALKLKVNNILENSIQFSGDDIELSARLFSNISGEYVWEKSWKCKRENTSFIRHKLLTGLADHFGFEIPIKIKEALSKEMTDNGIALKKYIEGRSLLEKLSDKSALQQAYKLFEEAVSLDDNFVEARAKYAFVCMKLGYYDKCEEVLDEAMDIADDSDNERGKIEVYNYLGNLYGVQHKIKKAQKNSEKALKLLQQYEDQSGESRCLYNLAGHMYYADKPSEALTFLDRARELKISLEENESLALVYALYGNIYTILKDHSQAIEYRERASSQCTEMGMEMLACKYLVALAGSHEWIGEHQKAADILKQAEELDGQSFDEGKILLIWARILIEAKDYKAALDKLKISEAIFQKRNNNRMVAVVYLEFANLFVRDDIFIEAEKYIDLVIEYCSKVRGYNMKYLPECMRLYAASDIKEDEIDQVYENVAQFQDDPNISSQWYFLSRAYEKAKNSSKSVQCRELSIKSLKKLSAYNSVKQHCDSMLKNHWLHREILGSVSTAE